MKVVAYQNDHSGLIEHEVIMQAPTETMTLEMIRDSIPINLNPIIVEQENLPSHIYYPAWEIVNGAIQINITKAQQVHLVRIRAKRKFLLQDLDILFQRALEENLDTALIVKEKKRLRDFPDVILATETMEELIGLDIEINKNNL